MLQVMLTVYHMQGVEWSSHLLMTCLFIGVVSNHFGPSLRTIIPEENLVASHNSMSECIPSSSFIDLIAPLFLHFNKINFKFFNM